ncbi:MAG: redoxin family protein [Bacteroidota bacterium]
MKKTIKIIAMAMLCLFLSGLAYAQTQALNVGDQVPDITINNITNYKTTSAKVSDFKGKLLIIDFWATWCGPCVAMVPKMNALQKDFGDKIQFLSVTYQAQKDVEAFLNRLEKQNSSHSELPVVFGDKQLKALFPHQTLPHYVWIDSEGRVATITGFDAVTSENIKKQLSQGSFETRIKKDVILNYDYSTPLFLDPNKAKLVRTQSVITGYIEGHRAAASYNVNSTNPDLRKKITATNLSMVRLYQVAMSKGTGKYTWDKTILEVSDTTKVRNRSSGSKYREWLSEGNGYCYELILPEKFSDPFAIMEQDLNRYFQNYSATIEKKPAEVLVLQKTSSSDLIKTKGGTPSRRIDATGCWLSNEKLSILNRWVDSYLKPVVDETGYQGNVDITLSADMDDLSAINKELSKYHLQYVTATREIEFLVIRDKVQPSIE